MDKLKSVKAVIYVNGIEVQSITSDVPDWAVGYVVGALTAQLDDPDIDTAREFMSCMDVDVSELELTDENRLEIYESI